MSEDTFKKLFCIALFGMLTGFGLAINNQMKLDRITKVTSNCKYLKSYEYFVLNHRHGRTGIVDEYQCPDGSTEKIYR